MRSHHTIEERPSRCHLAERGAGLVEYSLLVALIVGAVLGALTVVGSGASEDLDVAASSIDGPAASEDEEPTTTLRPVVATAPGSGVDREAPATTAPPTTTEAPPTTTAAPPTTAPPATTVPTTTVAPTGDGTGTAPTVGEVIGGDPGDGAGSESDALTGSGTGSATGGGDESPSAAAPASETSVASSSGEFYWFEDHPSGGDGQWKASVTFENDWIRHQYLTLEVTRVTANGKVTTETVQNHYVAAGSTSTYVAWSNDYRARGASRQGVVEVQVRVVQVRTSDENWQPQTFDVAGDVSVVGVPPMP